MIPADLHYNFLEGRYLFVLAIIVLFIGWSLYLFRQKNLEKFELLVDRSKMNYWGKVIGTSLVVFLATLACMEPIGNAHYPSGIKPPVKKEETILRRRAHDVIFLVDASASMSVKDTPTGISRFDEAKEIVDEIISGLRGENIALWAFTSEATKLSPLTLDYLFVRLRLKQMSINEGDVAGTDFAEALTTLRKEYFSTPSTIAKTLVILSDGGDKNTSIEGIPNLHVYTVGLGSIEGGTIPGVTYEGKAVVSRLNPEPLQALGQYYPGNKLGIKQIVDAITTHILREGSLENIKTAQALGNADLIYDDYFQIPLGIAILLFIFVIYFPDTRQKRAL